MSQWQLYRIGPGKQRQRHPVRPSSRSCCEGGLSLRGFPSGWIASSFLFWRSRSSGPYLLPTWGRPECQSLLVLVVVQSPALWSAALHQKPSNSGLQRESWVKEVILNHTLWIFHSSAVKRLIVINRIQNKSFCLCIFIMHI